MSEVCVAVHGPYSLTNDKWLVLALAGCRSSAEKGQAGRASLRSEKL